MFVNVPSSLWQEIVKFFMALVAPCKDCVRGNSHTCWTSTCTAFRFRPIAMRIRQVQTNATNLSRFMLVENEILNALAKLGGGPVPPSAIICDSTNSKANKYSAIARLIKQGRIIEIKTGKHSRLISLPKKKEPENEHTKYTNRRTTSGNSTDKLGTRPANPRRDPSAE